MQGTPNGKRGKVSKQDEAANRKLSGREFSKGGIPIDPDGKKLKGRSNVVKHGTVIDKDGNEIPKPVKRGGGLGK